MQLPAGCEEAAFDSRTSSPRASEIIILNLEPSRAAPVTWGVAVLCDCSELLRRGGTTWVLSFSGSQQGTSHSWISCTQLPSPLLLLTTPGRNWGWLPNRMIQGGGTVPTDPRPLKTPLF